MKTPTRHRRLTQVELLAEARERFGDDPTAYAFRCPNCADVASIKDFIEAGDPHGASAGQECIGRHLGALTGAPGKHGKNHLGRGCDWTAYGLFHGPWEIVMPADGDRPERVAYSFPLAEVSTNKGGTGGDG